MALWRNREVGREVGRFGDFLIDASLTTLGVVVLSVCLFYSLLIPSAIHSRFLFFTTT